MAAPYRLPTYNGFTHEERVATNPVQRQALADGRLVRPDTCCICGFSNSADPKGSGYIFLHLEDYRRPLEILPVCKACHAALHARFRDSERWQALLCRYPGPGRWYTLLSLDSASQTRAFDETYPDGLPGAWEFRATGSLAS